MTRNRKHPKFMTGSPEETPSLNLSMLEPVAEFVNEQMIALHHFMHEHLAVAVKEHAAHNELKSVPVGWGQRISCLGIESFRQANVFLA